MALRRNLIFLLPSFKDLKNFAAWSIHFSFTTKRSSDVWQYREGLGKAVQELGNLSSKAYFKGSGSKGGFVMYFNIFLNSQNIYLCRRKAKNNNVHFI